MEYTNELQPVEILMLSYVNKFHTSENAFQQFWTYKYNIEPDKVLKHLYDSGYIELAPIETNITKKTIPELKEILLDNGLSTSGKKTVLISRIVENIPPQQLQRYFLYRYYCLTRAGEYVIENNPNILFAHKNQVLGLAIDEVPTNGDIYEYLYNKLDGLMREYQYYNNWSGYRDCIFKYAKAAELQSQHEKAIRFYIFICYLDISGLRNGVEPDRIRTIQQYIIDSWGDPKKILANGVIFSIKDTAKKANLSDNDVVKICENVISNAHLPFHLFDKGTATKIIVERLYSDITYTADFAEQIPVTNNNDTAPSDVYAENTEDAYHNEISNKTDVPREHEYNHNLDKSDYVTQVPKKSDTAVKTEKNWGCLVAGISAICACPAIFIGVLFWAMEWHFISIVVFAIYIAIIYVCYKIGKKSPGRYQQSRN